MLIGIIIAIVGLGFLILAHEFGHFIVAKATGMRGRSSVWASAATSSASGWERRCTASRPSPGGYVRVTGMHKEEFEARVAGAREEEAEIRAEGGSVGPGSRRPSGRANGRRAPMRSLPLLERRYYSTPSGTSCSSSSPEWS